MVDTPSTMAPLGMRAPEFSLPDGRGKTVSINDFRESPALLVAFICNHCPFVQHILPHFVGLAREYQGRGAAIVAVNPNDIAAYPQDAPEHMAALADRMGFTFPFLYDENQQAAKAYGAACTPDFYLFDNERRLVYRGQMDDSRPKNIALITGRDLRAALDAVLAGTPVSPDQKPSIGCNIKWKEGNEPEYFRKSEV